MIEGYVTDALEAVVEIGLMRGDSATTIPAVVDTGFSGGVCLSEEYVEHVEMTFEYAETYELANGEVIVKDVFRGSILFNGRVQEVDLIFTSSQDSLIGASLLKDHRLIISYPERTVRIE